MTKEIELSQTTRSRGFSPSIGGDVAQVAGHDRHVEGDARPLGVVAHRARLSTVDARRKRRVAVEPTHHAVDVGMHQRHVVVDELLEVVDVFSVTFFCSTRWARSTLSNIQCNVIPLYGAVQCRRLRVEGLDCRLV